MTDAEPAPLVTHRRHPRRRRAPARDRDPHAARRRSGRPSARRFLKAESLQPIGAFKLRGAYVAVASLPPEAARAAASSPTRRATTPRASPARRACSARRPSSSCRPTRRRSSATGSRPTAPRSSSSAPPATSASEVAEAIAAERGLAIIPPFDDDRIIAGQGTVGLEIVEDLPDVAAVLVPIGGGGLASGVATAIKALRPGGAGHRRRARAGGRRARVARARARSSRWPAELVSRTIADGTRTQALGARTFAHLRAYLDSIVTVSEAEIAAARPAGRRAEPARRRAIGRAAASRRWRSTPREAGLDRRRRAGRRRGQRRERRPGARTASTSTRRSRPRAERTAAPVDPAAPSGRRLAALVGEPLGQPALADPDLRPARRRPGGRRGPRPAPRPASSPTTTARIAVRKTASPAIHMIPAASRWSSSAAIPHGRTSVA